MIRKFLNYIKDDSYLMTLSKEKLYIKDYLSIKEVTSKTIILCLNSVTLTIKGNNLSVKKMLEKDVLITGIITNLILGYEYE